MPLVLAKCTNCNANLEVNNSRSTAICPYCKSTYIVQDAIQKYNINVTNNFVAKNVNVIQESEFDRLRKMALFEEKNGDYGGASTDWHRLYNQYGYKMTEDDIKHLHFCENRSRIEYITDDIKHIAKERIKFANNGWDENEYCSHLDINKYRSELLNMDESAFKPGERDALLAIMDNNNAEVSRIKKRRHRENAYWIFGKIINALIDD